MRVDVQSVPVSLAMNEVMEIGIEATVEMNLQKQIDLGVVERSNADCGSPAMRFIIDTVDMRKIDGAPDVLCEFRQVMYFRTLLFVFFGERFCSHLCDPVFSRHFIWTLFPGGHGPQEPDV